MTNLRSPQNSVQRAAGIKSALQEKSRKRRQTQKSLTSCDRQSSGRNDLLPTLRVEYLPIDTLRPADRRVRRAEASQIAKVELSLKQFGVCSPILIDSDGRIVHGHVVWEAARRLGLEKMPVVRIDHLNHAERRALTIALNRLGETGDWDVEALKVEFDELIELEMDVIATGFELAEVDALLLDDEPSEDEADAFPPLPQLATSQPSDVWILGDHRLVQGDARAREVYTRLVAEGESIRLALTDVPFNVPIRGHCTGQAHHREFEVAHGELSREEFDTFNKDWMRLASDVLVDGGLLATFIDWRSVDLILSAGRELGLDLLNIVVWAKSNAGQGSLWRSQHEMLPVFKKGGAPHINNIELGRWVFNSVLTRFNDAPTGAFILVMHRLAPDDLSATLEPGADFVLKLPLIAENKEEYICRGRTTMYRKPGDVLNPEAMTREQAAKLKADLPGYVWNGQYQQRPTAGGSGMLSVERFQRFDLSKPPTFELTIHSWDVGATIGGNASVCTKWGLAPNKDNKDALHLTQVISLRLELPEVLAAIKSEIERDRPALIVIDERGVGLGVVQHLKRAGYRNISWSNATREPVEIGSDSKSRPSDSKIERFGRAILRIEDGQALIPISAPFLEKFLYETSAFPNISDDDQVDSMSQIIANFDYAIVQARRNKRNFG